MAVGPVLGGLLIRFTGHTLSVFYVATAVHIVYALLVWVAIPESLTKKDMAEAKAKYDEEMRESARERDFNPTVSFLVKLKRIFSFLSPLTIFTPEIERAEENPLKSPRRNWNLTLMAIGYGSTVSVMVCRTVR
jgi:MFS family permease